MPHGGFAPDASIFAHTVGCCVIFLSTFLLLPEILKRRRCNSNSALLPTFLVVLSSSCTAAYSHRLGFNFSQWGDAAVLSGQSAVLICQSLRASNKRMNLVSFLCFYVCFLFLSCNHLLPLPLLTLLQTACIILALLARGSQLYNNHRGQSTTALSKNKVSLLLFVSVARAFTSLQLCDWITILSSCLAAILNTLLWAQVQIYNRRSTNSKKNL